MAWSDSADFKGGAGKIKGLRLLTMARAPEGFGFHMYTNKERDGQYIKSVTPNSPADLAGMLPNDHVVGVDDTIVIGETHIQVVERVRTGAGQEKKILVVDIETEDEMKQRGEEITIEGAIVMIPREPEPVEVAPPPPMEETDSAAPLANEPTLNFSNMEAARRKGRQQKKDVKSSRSWKESIDAYNNL